MKNSISSWARALTVLTLATTITACNKSSHKKRENTIKYEIRVMKPESRVYNIYIPASLHGVTEVEVYPQVSGIIREVNFKDGNEVYQQLRICHKTEQKAAYLSSIVNSLHEAYIGTSELMKNGTNTYVEVLKAQEDLLTAQITEVQNHYEGVQALINLYSALGGF